MPRPQIPAGELGRIQVAQLASGRYRARASTRDDAGVMHRLTATASTEADAHADLRRQAAALSTGGTAGLAPSSTIATVVEAWLAQILTRARAGSLAFTTYESYETTARVIILPRCGGVPAPGETPDSLSAALLARVVSPQVRRMVIPQRDP